MDKAFGTSSQKYSSFWIRPQGARKCTLIFKSFWNSLLGRQRRWNKTKPSIKKIMHQRKEQPGAAKRPNNQFEVAKVTVDLRMPGVDNQKQQNLVLACCL